MSTFPGIGKFWELKITSNQSHQANTGYKRKDICQAVCCPINVPKGTPVTVATVKPVNIIAMALARRDGGTTSAAMTVETDMKMPCANAESIRPTNKIINVGANAAIKFH